MCVCVSVRVTAVQQLSALLSREDCQLTSLCLEDSQLKELTNMILEALVDNTSLAKINLRYHILRMHVAIIELCMLCMQWQPDGEQRCLQSGQSSAQQLCSHRGQLGSQ